MDYEALEKRICEIEEVLGIDDFVKPKSIPTEIENLQRKLKDECKASILMTIPVKKLEDLSKIALEYSTQPSGSLTEKLESLKFCEPLIYHRVELIKQFEEFAKTAQDAELFSKPGELQSMLDDEIAHAERLLEEWNGINAEFKSFCNERSYIMQKITERTLALQTKINAQNA